MSVKVYTYKGRGIDALSREELLEALRRAYDELQDARDCAHTNAEMEALFRRTAGAIHDRRALALRRIIAGLPF